MKACLNSVIYDFESHYHPVSATCRVWDTSMVLHLCFVSYIISHASNQYYFALFVAVLSAVNFHYPVIDIICCFLATWSNIRLPGASAIILQEIDRTGQYREKQKSCDVGTYHCRGSQILSREIQVSDYCSQWIQWPLLIWWRIRARASASMVLI